MLFFLLLKDAVVVAWERGHEGVVQGLWREDCDHRIDDAHESADEEREEVVEREAVTACEAPREDRAHREGDYRLKCAAACLPDTVHHGEL